MTITADDLRDEFTDFKGRRSLTTDVQYLLFLLKHKILRAEKFTFSENFQYCFNDLLFDSFRTTEHLKNHNGKIAYILFKIKQFVKSLKDVWAVGSEISYYGQGGYRSDIGVLISDSDSYHILLAIEVGATEWTKIEDCLLHLLHLKEIWHFPDYDDYFIWRRGKNYKLLTKLLKDNREWLKQLEEKKQKELAKIPLWR